MTMNACWLLRCYILSFAKLWAMVGPTLGHRAALAYGTGQPISFWRVHGRIQGARNSPAPGCLWVTSHLHSAVRHARGRTERAVKPVVWFKDLAKSESNCKANELLQGCGGTFCEKRPELQGLYSNAESHKYIQVPADILILASELEWMSTEATHGANLVADRGNTRGGVFLPFSHSRGRNEVCPGFTVRIVFLQTSPKRNFQLSPPCLPRCQSSNQLAATCPSSWFPWAMTGCYNFPGLSLKKQQLFWTLGHVLLTLHILGCLKASHPCWGPNFGATP